MTNRQRSRWAASILLTSFSLILIGCEGSSTSDTTPAVDATPAVSDGAAADDSRDSGGGSHSK